jgi:hypothetical protein
MQQDMVAEFFTRLVILIVLLMMLSVIAMPEIVSIIEESFTRSSEVEFMDGRSAVTGIPDAVIFVSINSAGRSFVSSHNL